MLSFEESDMPDDIRTFDELQAEQDAYWAEAAKTPQPEGYAEWVRAQVDEAIRECEQPGAVFYTQEEFEHDTELQIRSWRARERRRA